MRTLGYGRVKLKCPACESACSSLDKFCPSCGASLLAQCHNCQANVSVTASFCQACGAPLVNDQPDVPPRAERGILGGESAVVTGPRGTGWTGGTSDQPTKDASEAASPDSIPSSHVRDVALPKRVVGEVVGFEQRTEGMEIQTIIWEFRVIRYDDEGNRLPVLPIPVEMRGYSIEGDVNDGDRVEAFGKWGGGRIFQATRVNNISTGSLVRVKVQSSIVGIVILVFVLISFTLGGFSGAVMNWNPPEFVHQLDSSFGSSFEATSRTVAIVSLLFGVLGLAGLVAVAVWLIRNRGSGAGG